jgi:tetratricopeptide (TPR) repeat protein
MSPSAPGDDLVGRFVVEWKAKGPEHPDVVRMLEEHPALREALGELRGFEDLLVRAAGAADDPDPVAPGALVGGLRVERRLGCGGMGEVWSAYDPALRRHLAVKVLRRRLDLSEVARRRFVEEAHITAQLQHPGIVPVHAVGTLDDGRPYLVMKLVEGRTLAEFLKARKSPGDDLPPALRVFEQVCETVAYAHSRGVIHRDLKPSNVMVGAFGEVQVMDWGLARPLDNPAESPLDTPRGACETWTDAGLGTYAYMSPEQATGRVAEVDRRSDVFGLGAILCDVLTGRPPGPGEPTAPGVSRSPDEANRRLSACGADRELIDLALACLAADRDARPADAGEVARRVAAHRAAVAERLRQQELAEARRQERRKRRRVAAGLAVALLAALGLGAAAYRQREATRAEVEAAFEADLLRAASLRETNRFDEADESLSQAERRLNAWAGPGRRESLAQARRTLATARKLEDIRLDKVIEIGRSFDFARADQSYQTLFEEEFGCHVGSDPADAADQLRASAEPRRLIDALDDWARITKSESSRAWALAVGRALDEGTPWNRFRDETAWTDPVAARELIEVSYRADVPASIYLMLAAQKRTDRRLALAILRAAYHRREADFWVNFELGLLLSYLKRDEEALGFFRAAAALRPTVIPAVQNNIATCLMTLGRTEEAIVTLKRLIDSNPNFPIGHYNYGQAILRLEAQARAKKGGINEYHLLGPHFAAADLSELAIESYRRAIEIDSTYAQAHNNLAKVLERKGRFREAVHHFREALRLDPKLPQPRYNLFELALGLHEPEAAWQALRTLPDPKLEAKLVTRGNESYWGGKLDESCTAYLLALEINPRNATAVFNLAFALRKQNRFAENIPYLKRGIDLQPGNSDAWNDLAESYAAVGDAGAAASAYQSMIAVMKPNDDRPWVPLVRLLYAQGRFVEGLRYALAGRTALKMESPKRTELDALLGAGK